MVVFKHLSDSDVIAALRSGEVGVVPTDTIYGLVCQAANQAAVARLYKIKHREHEPGTIIAASIEQFEGLGIKRRYLKAVEHFWPNPISIVIPTGLQLPYLDQGKMSLAIRIPNQKPLLDLLQKTGPLLTSSANQPSEKPATTIAEAKNYFKNKVDFYVDGGNLSSKKPSTIIRIVDDAVEVLRAGAVKIDETTGRIVL